MEFSKHVIENVEVGLHHRQVLAKPLALCHAQASYGALLIHQGLIPAQIIHPRGHGVVEVGRVGLQLLTRPAAVWRLSWLMLVLLLVPMVVLLTVV